MLTSSKQCSGFQHNPNYLQKDFVDNLDTLPMPAWDLIDISKFGMELDNHYNPKNLPLKFKSALFSSRACPLDCNFCDMFLVMGKKHRKRSVKKIRPKGTVRNLALGIVISANFGGF